MIWHLWIKNTLKIVLGLGLVMAFSCNAQQDQTASTPQPAAEKLDQYLPLLQNKKVGLVANQTSVISVQNGKNRRFIHLADTLQARGIQLQKVFAPEHGFRGKADAGAYIANGIDKKTGLEVISLYGNNKKPLPEDLSDIDLMVFDIQDVGARFYTYLSTLHYIMEACAEQNIPLIVLDRPNPNGDYIDGPVLQEQFKSFVGMHPVPVVYGMTIGEYALMIDGESWIETRLKTNLTIIPVSHYDHNTHYSLPIPPSPNLRSDQAIALYPSLCFFEGTPISAGRGTERPFELFGSPHLDPVDYPFKFMPRTGPGAGAPKFKDQSCQGLDLARIQAPNKIELSWLINTYKSYVLRQDMADSFFNSFFDKLAGTDQLRKDILRGLTLEEIRSNWTRDIDEFKKVRAKYLLYPEGTD